MPAQTQQYGREDRRQSNNDGQKMWKQAKRHLAVGEMQSSQHRTPDANPDQRTDDDSPIATDYVADYRHDDDAQRTEGPDAWGEDFSSRIALLQNPYAAQDTGSQEVEKEELSQAELEANGLALISAIIGRFLGC